MNNSLKNPPKIAVKILSWFAGRADLEDIQGDMDEMYCVIVNEKGRFSANIYYWRQVISLIFSYALSRRKSHQAYSSHYSTNEWGMIHNYFKVAFRNFSKHKLFTSINVVGLALGMSICLLALSIIVAVYRSDDNHENKERIFQINTQVFADDFKKIYGSTFTAVGDELEEKYPFVEHVVKIHSEFQPEVTHQGNLLNFRGYFADASFFDVFSFDMISGNPATALAQPYSVVITQNMAEKLYKDDNPIGHTLETDMGNFTIMGVMKNPKQTHLYFEVLASHSTFQQLQPNFKSDWSTYRNNYVYVLLKNASDKEALNNALAQMSALASSFNPNQTIELQSAKLTDVVPRWDTSNAIGIGWDQASMLFFLGIGLLVLLPAVFNYTNLSIARALKRAKEIGIRKVVGAEKHQIKAQFIVETILLALLALVGSIMLYLPMKNEFLGLVRSSEVMNTEMGWIQILVFIVFAVLVGLLAGIFPARYFARLNPIQIMKGEAVNGTNSVSGVKKGLFIFQFFLSLVFIIGVGTLARQYRYVLNQNHGFESNNVLAIPFANINKTVALTELEKHPDVNLITSSSNLPGLFLSVKEELTPNDVDTIAVNQVFIGDHFIENMEMKLVWGESQSLEKSNQNEERVLVNQQFIKSANIFNTQHDSLTFRLGDGTNCRVVGILEDFNFEPLNEQINPILFRYSIEKGNYALLTVNTTDIKKTVNDLNEIWTTMDQTSHFEATFLNDEIEKAYYFLTIQIKFFSYLSALAIIISCLGLLGMVSYNTENRTKEIAVRKIMGASNYSLYYLLTKDFVKLILVSAMIAVPFSYFFYEKLFLYNVLRYGSGMGVLEVIGGIVFLFLVGFASIYWQTSKVAKANPAGNLRYE
ncbi:MAG: putative ABC transport system permease protein [Cyclobacteriaceae bacterium]|jgi:ABC-type antimicrobial peptide transport system permease subunit